MAKSFFKIFIIYLINISITISYDINDRTLNNIDYEQPKIMLNETNDFSSSSLKINHCIPVQAVKELGCTLSARNNLFQGLFQSACEQHQLCYACGFAHGITAHQCNKLASLTMYDLCFQDEVLSFSICLKQHFSAIKLLRRHVYRSFSDNPGYFFECRQQCVFDYLHDN